MDNKTLRNRLDIVLILIFALNIFLSWNPQTPVLVSLFVTICGLIAIGLIIRIWYKR